MTKLDDRQSARLGDLRRAWKAQQTAMQELLEKQAKEQKELAETMYTEVVKATALALEAGVPKRKMGPAVGTANYTANRKGLHKDALDHLATLKPLKAVIEGTEIDLRDENQSEQWASNLTLTYVGEDLNMDKFEVQDPAGLVQTLYDQGVFPACYDVGVTPAIEAAIVDQEDIIKRKMREAKN